MSNTGRRFLTVLIVGALIAIPAFLALAQQDDSTGQHLVYVLPIEGTIDEGLAAYVQRGIHTASVNKADALLIEINTFGGRVDSATEIRDAFVAADIPVLAFVTDRAWSAGALIALSARKIAMAPGSSIGAAQPEPTNPKTVSALRGEFEATAERNGRDARLAAAMVDARIAIDGVVDEGQILTLSAAQAAQLGFIDFIGNNRGDVLSHFGYRGAAIEVVAPNWAERIARFLSDPSVSTVLMMIGFLGLLAEVTTPGWGVPGTAGVLALVLFFGARLITGLAGLEVMLLFVFGIALLMLEIFVIPGFGIVGVLGLIAMFAGLYLSFPDMTTALSSIGFAAGLSIVGGVLLLRRVPTSGIWSKISLETKLEDPGFTGGDEDIDAPAIAVGTLGRALTPLRPAGTIEVGGKRIDAVSDGGFIPAGATTEIVRVFGTRVTVREYTD